MDVTQPERGTKSVAPALMAVGGAIGVVGSILTWASVSISRGTIPGQGRLGGQGGLQGRAPGASGRSPSPGMQQGTLPSQGRVPGGGGRAFTVHGLDTTSGRLVLALCIALIVVAVFGWLAPRLWFRLGAVAIGLVLGVIVLVLAVVNLASPDALFGAVGTRLSTAGIPVSIGIGLWLVLAGALVAVAAAAFWLVTTRKSWAGPAGAAPLPVPIPPPRQDLGSAEQPTTQLPPLTEPGLSTE
jgi:hypothetical protein